MDERNDGGIVPGPASGASGGSMLADGGEGQLLTRFLAGLVLLGSDELLARLRALEIEIEAGDAGGAIPGDETMGELVGYLAFGLFLRGHKRVSRGIRRGIRRSMATTGRALDLLNRLTDNPLGRPLRQPVERRIWDLVLESQLAIGEGRRQAQHARLLAGRTLAQVTDDLMAYILEDPELVDLIRRQVAEQGAGLTGTAVGNVRQLGAGADDAIEGAVRRLLRRKPRRELPPSSLAGDPQRVYVAGTPSGESDDGE
jgi:hypothetical protein